jgi:hypothetical protein
MKLVVYFSRTRGFDGRNFVVRTVNKRLPKTLRVPPPDEEFDALGEDELALLIRRFERLHENRVNTRRTT